MDNFSYDASLDVCNFCLLHIHSSAQILFFQIPRTLNFFRSFMLQTWRCDTRCAFIFFEDIALVEFHKFRLVFFLVYWHFSHAEYLLMLFALKCNVLYIS